MEKKKVIIADDEIYICTLVNSLIKWDELGIELLDVCHNGQEVLEVFKTNKVDILICDIEMPAVDGIELIKTVTKDYPNCKCIVISGFRNFDYAKSIMSYGVNHYILKPINEEELNNALREVLTSGGINKSEDLLLSENATRKALIDAIINNDISGPINEINVNYKYHFESNRFIVLYATLTNHNYSLKDLLQVRWKFETEMANNIRGFSYDFEFFQDTPSSEIVIINYDNTNEDKIYSYLDEAIRKTIYSFSDNTNCRCFVSINDKGCAFEGIKDACDKVKKLNCYRFIDANYHIINDQLFNIENMALNSKPLESKESVLIQKDIVSLDANNLRKDIYDAFYSRETNIKSNPFIIYELFQEVVSLTVVEARKLEIIDNKNNDIFNNAALVFNKSDTITSIVESYISMFDMFFEESINKNNDNVSTYINEAKSYIAKHYSEEISLDNIAEKLGISPVYLSTAFKNHENTNYITYLTSVRMEEAKRLLKDPRNKVNSVAKEVGYISASHFSKIFLEYTGLKPLEYSKLYKKGFFE